MVLVRNTRTFIPLQNWQGQRTRSVGIRVKTGKKKTKSEFLARKERQTKRKRGTKNAIKHEFNERSVNSEQANRIGSNQEIVIVNETLTIIIDRGSCSRTREREKKTI
jgi:ribosome assembly protein YihI (activator of Der GTPase)